MSSKIPEATTKIKKKLSFDDVKPVYQSVIEQAEQQEWILTSLEQEKSKQDLTLCQHTSELVDKQTGLTVNHIDIKAVNHFDNKQVDNQDGLPVSQINSKEVKHLDGEPATQNEMKKKATYYLTERAHKLMDEMFVKSILNGKKKDKSVLICEAIELLYQRERV
jgi:hypothetical protein